MEIWAALGIGFLGSFHCIGMCGPIALALPTGNSSKLSFITNRILYNTGRIVTYSILGIIFGFIGESVALAGFQNILSITLGALILLSVFVKNRYFESIKKSTGINTVLKKVRNKIGEQFKKNGWLTFFIIGILNGLLPCGFVYIGLAGSLTTGSVWEGALFMTLFGAGTFPAMFAMSLAPGFLSLSTREKINRAIPALAILFGLYLIYRGTAMGPMMTH